MLTCREMLLADNPGEVRGALTSFSRMLKSDLKAYESNGSALVTSHCLLHVARTYGSDSMRG